MSTIQISKETFEHALKKLTAHEIQSIFEEETIKIEVKQTKEDSITQLLTAVDEGKITGEMYVRVREQAFSISKNFYDGFYYKIDDVFENINVQRFEKALIEKARGTKNDKKVNIINSLINSKKIAFTYKQSNKSLYYDTETQTSTACRQLIDVDIRMDFDNLLLYIHSKNCMDVKKIVTFINKTLLVLVPESKEKRKRFLSEPKFDLSIAEKWYERNKNALPFKVENTTIHMLDLLFHFTTGEEGFSNLCTRTIYFKENTIHTGEEVSRLTDVRLGGENLQNHIRTLEEIKNGKKILGFKIEVDYLALDPETDEEAQTKMQITILYEEKNYLRVTINTGVLFQIKEEVLRTAYQKIQSIFVKKFTAVEIFNTDELITYLMQTVEMTSQVEDKSNQEDEDDENETWSL